MGSEINRRDAIKRAVAIGVVAVPSASLLSACASSGGGSDKPKADPTGAKTANNPLGVKKGTPLEAFIFKGGFGDSYVKAAETVYNSEYGIKVKHTGTQGLGPKLQPRFASNTPPDIMDNSGADNLDTAALAKESKLQDLTPLLDAPTIDDPSKKVRDVLIAGTVEQGQFGTQAMYAFNYAFTVYGGWYSNKLFQDKGWEYPQTFDQALALGAKAKKENISSSPTRASTRTTSTSTCSPRSARSAARTSSTPSTTSRTAPGRWTPSSRSSGTTRRSRRRSTSCPAPRA